jgi:DinB family protein
MMGRPEASEYPARHHRYIDLVPEDDVSTAMAEQLDRTVAFLRAIPIDDIDRRYAPGKWTVREVVGHILDTNPELVDWSDLGACDGLCDART